MFNVPQTAGVILETGHGLRVSSDRLEEPGVKLGTPGNIASGLPTTPRQLL